MENPRPAAASSSSSSSAAFPRTLATAFTTFGHPLHVSLRLAEPPAASRVCIQLPRGIETEWPTVVAAHGDSLLITIRLVKDMGPYIQRSAPDFFVYNAGAAVDDDAAPRPPSLSLLPPCCVTEETSARLRSQDMLSYATYATGLLRHSEDEFVVAELMLKEVSTTNTPGMVTPELLLFRCGEWIVKRPLISHDGRELRELPLWSTTDITGTVPAGDRQLCWVNLSTGVLICDNVFDENPRLHYVELPVDPCHGQPELYRNVCATAGGGALKFVNVYRRCCCGGVGVTDCQRSHGAYVINTWTLRMSDMKWVKDAMVDATELWALDAYKGLPCIPLDHPDVSMDEPYVICFVLLEIDEETYHQKSWMLMVDTRSKTIRSVLPADPGDQAWDPSETLIPSDVSYYLNSKAQSQVDMERSLVQIRDDDDDCREANDSILQSSCDGKSSA
nr:unnamed protein product [Digitaria exilis]